MKNVTIRRSRPRAISKKREAERLAAGETFIRSTVRSSPLSGSSIKKGRKTIKKKPRSASETVRIYGTKAHRQWFHWQACAACGIQDYTQIAHVGNGGMGKKAKMARAIPLCGPHTGWTGARTFRLIEGCHAEQHRMGAKSFAAKYRLDYDALCEFYASAWQSHLSPRGIGSNG